MLNLPKFISVKKHKHHFLKLPQIIGGKEALKKYIEANMVYPEEAKLKRIEGAVELDTEIDDNGQVISVEIRKGLAGGCNEEAVRLIKNIRFGQVKNKGIRLKTKKHFKISFKLPLENTVNYHLVENMNKHSAPKTGESYSYTINIS